MRFFPAALSCLLCIAMPAHAGQLTSTHAFQITPLEAPANLNQEKVALGRKLFHDTRLSTDNSISCASCHGLDTGGVDNLQYSLGVNNGVGGINAPTVYNSGLNLAQFWDGRAKSLEDQVNGPTHNPLEMGSNWKEIIGKLSADTEYPGSFESLYGKDGLNEASIRDAIATFERSLVTVNSPFDRYLKGDTAALSEEARRGYNLFESYGCISCHQGANVGGNMFQVMGVFGDYFADRGHLTDADTGRMAVTKNPRDKGKFKVPSLRLVTLTAPYFHDGSASTLQEAIQVMAKYQLGRKIPDQHVQLIIAFLTSLKGELQEPLQ